jgi:hypothetical protein
MEGENMNREDLDRAFREYSDTFYVNMSLSTETESVPQRETLLNFFERLRKQFPTMRNFYAREKGEFVLDSEKESGSYRWVTVDAKRISSGFVNPPSLEAVMQQHRFVLELVPYLLSISNLDCESLSLMYCFDFNYRGNQNELVGEALGLPAAFERFSREDSPRIIGYEPAILFSMEKECRTQVRLSIDNRTTAFHVRTGEYPEDQLTVILTARHYGSLTMEDSFCSTLDRLATVNEKLVEEFVAENILSPLRQAIAIK